MNLMIKFGKVNKDCWIGMFNNEYIVKPSILKAISPIDAISKALVFVKSEDFFNCIIVIILEL
jgi:hypothetical protein